MFLTYHTWGYVNSFGIFQAYFVSALGYDIDDSLSNKSRTQMEEQAVKMTKGRRKHTNRMRAEWVKKRENKEKSKREDVE